MYGYDAARVLNERILESMRRKGPNIQRYLHQDRE